MKERMLAGEPYLADDPELIADHLRALRLMERINGGGVDDHETRRTALHELLGEIGAEAGIRPPFYCDYGYHIRIGPRSFVNYHAVFLDVAPITIGATCRSARTCNCSPPPTRWSQHRVGRSGRRPGPSPSATTPGSAVER